MRLTREFRLGALIFGLALAIGLATMPSPPAARSEPAGNETKSDSPARAEIPRYRVIDGDTLEDMGADITFRIENIDTPETGSRARCQAERDLGNRATQQARALISSGDVELRPTGRIDRYGRTIAFVLIDGRDLGETLIASGLARPWRGRREPWCDASGNLLP